MQTRPFQDNYLYLCSLSTSTLSLHFPNSICSLSLELSFTRTWMPCWIAAQRLPPHPVVLSSGAHCNKKAREQKPLKVNCVQVPNPSPTNPLPKRAGPSPGSSAEKTAKPAPAPVQGGSDKKKTLSSEAISGLKGQIAEGLQQVNQNKKDSRKANQSAAKQRLKH